ncbi:MAG: hypothetical protein LBL23_05020 [Coriobacteriales bacterium]|nr:hypothetical protein [Coriobacteriales bacterium]
MASVKTGQAAVGRIVQNGEFCFETVGPHTESCADYTEHVECGSCLAFGSVNQLAFERKFLIEDMDYVFSSKAHIACQPKEPFIEILCLDSIEAVHCEQDNTMITVQQGVHIHFHQAEKGEL